MRSVNFNPSSRFHYLAFSLQPEEESIISCLVRAILKAPASSERCKTNFRIIYSKMIEQNKDLTLSVFLLFRSILDELKIPGLVVNDSSTYRGYYNGSAYAIPDPKDDPKEYHRKLHKRGDFRRQTWRAEIVRHGLDEDVILTQIGIKVEAVDELILLRKRVERLERLMQKITNEPLD